MWCFIIKLCFIGKSYFEGLDICLFLDLFGVSFCLRLLRVGSVIEGVGSFEGFGWRNIVY